MSKPAPKTLADLVAEGHALKTAIKAESEELKAIEAQIIDAGSGEHTGNGGTSCTVISPLPGIKPGPKDVQAVKEIAGDLFGKIFERKVSFAPVKAFREVVSALFDKRKAVKITELCEKQSTAFVKWNT